MKKIALNIFGIILFCNCCSPDHYEIMDITFEGIQQDNNSTYYDSTSVFTKKVIFGISYQAILVSEGWSPDGWSTRYVIQ